MLKPAAMVRMDALVLKQDIRFLLQELGRKGVVELTAADRTSGFCHAPDTSLAACDALLLRIREVAHSLGLQELPPSHTAPPFSLVDVQENLQGIEADAMALQERQQTLQEQLSRITATCALFEGFEHLDIPLDLQRRSAFLHFVVGVLPPEHLGNVRRSIESDGLLVEQPPLGGTVPVLVFCTTTHRAVVAQVLADAGFIARKLPALDGNSSETLRRQQEDERHRVLQALELHREEFERRRPSLAAHLSALQHTVEIERALCEAAGSTAHSDATVWIQGWLPASEQTAVEHLVATTSRECCFVHFEPSRYQVTDPEPPVLLRSPSWLRPFDRLVTAYGLPRPRELAPTAFLALSYVIMFGLMFGDIGHGLLLVAAGVLAWRLGKKAFMRDGGLILIYAGFSSLAFGIVYGSFFGMPGFRHLALWQDPIEGNPAYLMGVSLCFGIVLISAGVLLNVVNRFTCGDFADGIFGKFGIAGVLFYWGAITVVALTAFGGGQSATLLIAKVLVGLALAAWILQRLFRGLSSQGRRSSPPSHDAAGGFGLALAESLVEAFEGVLVYLANTISFVRLAAYSMSHAALLAAFFMMAESVQTSTPAAGVAIIVLGNIVAMVLEGVIAAVQALRLEYYEFFGKFFSGQGRPFRPFVLGNPMP